jgi:hypothetical protein
VLRMVSGGDGLGWAMLIEESITATMAAPAKRLAARLAALVLRRMLLQTCLIGMGTLSGWISKDRRHSHRSSDWGNDAQKVRERGSS